MGKNKSHTKGKIILVILLSLVVISVSAIGIYFATRPRLPDNTIICGVDLSDTLYTDAELIFEEKLNNYTLQVTAADQAFEITGEDLGLVFLKDNFITVMESVADPETAVDPWSVISLDQDKLNACVNKNFSEKREAPVSPVITYDASDARFLVTPGKPETWYSSAILADLVLEAVTDLAATLEVPAEALYQESFDTDLEASAVSLASKAETLIGNDLECIFNPRHIELGRETIDSTTLGSFIRFDLAENLIYADQDAISSYVENIVGKYEYQKYRDRFVTHDGDRIELHIPVKSKSVDVEKLTSLIANTLVAGSANSIEVPYTGYLNFEGTYIEVCIPQQHLWYYENDVVVFESDVVTGWEGLGRRTPTGVNYVGGHLADLELFNDYPVEYWMSITPDGIYGFHDADNWREPEEYGGKTYETDGSGGCVNLPLANMEKLYNMVADGTPIMIYNYYHYDGY